MSKYTAEEVEFRAAAVRCGENDITANMLRDYAALLRERESAKAGVTSQMRATACDAYDKEMVGHGEPANPVAMRAALEAVAPMLASARVPDLENALRMVVAANAMLSEIEDNKTLYEGSPLHSTRCLLAWDNLNTAIANAKQLLTAAPKPETEE